MAPSTLQIIKKIIFSPPDHGGLDEGEGEAEEQQEGDTGGPGAGGVILDYTILYYFFFPKLEFVFWTFKVELM